MTTRDSEPYHPRRMDKDMPAREDQLAVIAGQAFLTLALCRDNRPYMVALNYVYDQQENCFYVHCDNEGRKLEFLQANANVWGMIVEDRGYIRGKCSHSYRSVMFEATAGIIAGITEKRRRLADMIDKYEPEPEKLKSRLLGAGDLSDVLVIRLKVQAMSGKESPPRAS